MESIPERYPVICKVVRSYLARKESLEEPDDPASEAMNAINEGVLFAPGEDRQPPVDVVIKCFSHYLGGQNGKSKQSFLDGQYDEGS